MMTATDDDDYYVNEDCGCRTNDDRGASANVCTNFLWIITLIFVVSVVLLVVSFGNDSNVLQIVTLAIVTTSGLILFVTLAVYGFLRLFLKC